jgi:hypothetical protein
MGFIRPIVFTHIYIVGICDGLNDISKFVTIRFQITVRAEIFFIVSGTRFYGFLSSHLFINNLTVCLVSL